MMEGDPLAVTVREFLVTLVDDSRAVLRAERRVALACKRPAHEVNPRRATCNFAAMLEFVAFADGRLHILITRLIPNGNDFRRNFLSISKSIVVCISLTIYWVAVSAPALNKRNTASRGDGIIFLPVFASTFMKTLPHQFLSININIQTWNATEALIVDVSISTF